MSHTSVNPKATTTKQPMTWARILPRVLGLLMLATALIWTALPGAGVALAQDGAEPTVVPAEEIAGGVVDLTVQAAENTAGLIEDTLSRIVQSPRSELGRLLLVIGGVVLLFAGWRLYEFVVLIAGFVVGAALALALFNPDSNEVIITTAALLLGGVAGALLGFFLYHVAVFVIGAYIGIALTNGAATALALAPVSPLVLLVGGIIGGLLLLGLSFEFLILVAALIGAQMLTLGLGLDAAWTLIFAVVGVILQLVLVRSTGFNWRTGRRYVYRPRRA